MKPADNPGVTPTHNQFVETGYGGNYQNCFSADKKAGNESEHHNYQQHHNSQDGLFEKFGMSGGYGDEYGGYGDGISGGGYEGGDAIPSHHAHGLPLNCFSMDSSLVKPASRRAGRNGGISNNNSQYDNYQSVMRPAESPDPSATARGTGPSSFSFMKKAESPPSHLQQHDENGTQPNHFSWDRNTYTSSNPYSQRGTSGNDCRYYDSGPSLLKPATPTPEEELKNDNEHPKYKGEAANMSATIDAATARDTGPTDAEYEQLMFASMEDKAKASVVKENVGRHNSMADLRAKLLADKLEEQARKAGK